MSQHIQFVNLDTIITDYLTESEQSNHKYFKLFHLAFRGMEQLGLDFFYQVKSLKLPVLANLTVPLPADFLSYQKVGVFNSVGEVIPLKYNDKLTTFADLLPNRLDVTVDNTLFDVYVAASPIFYNYWNGDVFVNLYGCPSGAPFVGGFKVDVSNGVILLGENFGYQYIVLEYVASPAATENYPVPVQFREALIAWLAWKDISNMGSKSHMSLGDKQIRRKEFYNERRLANARWNPIYLSEAYELNLDNQRMTVKA